MKYGFIAVVGAISCNSFASAPARAGEIFSGVYAHDVKTPLDLAGIEPGVDIQLGYRGSSLFQTRLQPYAFAALNSVGETSYAAAGLSLRIGRKVYVRPGVGLAIHNGSDANVDRRDRVAFGSRILFAPELAFGVQLGNRLSAEFSLVHFSHAQAFGKQNPGIDNIGLRLNLKL